ncbi:MAG: alpha/beta hydrolase [Butyrivibrio sp.]|nr:alpha/beta hydrolase [Butyrivibrio sp.]
MSELVEMIRKNFKENDDIRDFGLTTPADIERFDDIVYGEDEKWQVLDVYRPKDAEGKLPVIISIHGGAWVYGDKQLYQYYCMSLAQRGFAVVNFTYRLAPEFKYPAQLIDTNLVAGFVVDNSDKYGFDLKNIFAVGDSAGGHLLGLYSCLVTNKEYSKKMGIEPPKDFSFKAVALNCGIYLVDPNGAREQDLSLMKEFLPGGATKEELKEISVAEHITGAFPPAFIMTADGDFLKDQPRNLIDKLLAVNVPHTFRYYSIPEKQLGHVFHLNIRLSEAAKCNDEEFAFFKGFVD